MPGRSRCRDQHPACNPQESVQGRAWAVLPGKRASVRGVLRASGPLAKLPKQREGPCCGSSSDVSGAAIGPKSHEVSSGLKND